MIEIRLATPDDAAAYTRCYIDCLDQTYQHIMPPAFAQMRRDDFDEECSHTHHELVAMEQALAHGRQPARTHWVAQDGADLVGIVSSGPGVAAWERMHYQNPPAAVDFNLDHIYTLRRTHGTGLGQRLLDTALATPEFPQGRGAWLWILRENPRAEAFYRRNGFTADGLEVTCGASWFHRPMFRMWRPDPS